MGQPQDSRHRDHARASTPDPSALPRLASHYVFEPLFCMPARGNEKPDAESTVRAVQRRFATPVPRVRDLAELNAYFRQRCLAELERTVQSPSGVFQIGTRFAEEKAAAMRLPNHRFDPCVVRPAAQVDKYQTVAFDTNRYSVPRPYAFQMVTIKGYVDRVVIVAAGQVIANHPRCLKRHTLVLDPIHYLATLMRKPGAGPFPGIPGAEASGLLHPLPGRVGRTARYAQWIAGVCTRLATAGRSSLTPRAKSGRGLPSRATDQCRSSDPADAHPRCL